MFILLYLGIRLFIAWEDEQTEFVEGETAVCLQRKKHDLGIWINYNHTIDIGSELLF